MPSTPFREIWLQFALHRVAMYCCNLEPSFLVESQRERVVVGRHKPQTFALCEGCSSLE
jgi:hypothetical protein